MTKIKVLDTTLRDGEQGEGISFTLQDKLAITDILDAFGVHYIEGGWPGSNPKAQAYFDAVKSKKRTSKIMAFGSTRRAKNTVENDPNLQALIKADPDGFVIVGKTWDFHVTEALGISLDENIALIEESIRYLKATSKEVIFDAEHFFDGYKHNAEYAIKAVKAAEKAGVDCVTLCDTNGGTLPSEIATIVKDVKSKITCEIGIHTHNDSGLGVATSIAAIEEGATHVQGTINGYGERCGNANLSSIIPVIQLKLNKDCVTEAQLETLSKVCLKIAEIANMSPQKNQPFVGKSAFAHKGGIHVSAVLKHPETYEHIDPKSVGNSQRVLISELSGGSNILYKAKEFGMDIESTSDNMANIIKTLKDREHQGYHFEVAEASFELLMKTLLGDYTPQIHLESYHISAEHKDDKVHRIHADITTTIHNEEKTGAADGNGPVSALDHALRTLVEEEFPSLKEVKLMDYKVRVLGSKGTTDAIVRVLITSTDGQKTWTTIGVSENIIEASWQALIDSYEYKLMEVGHHD